MVANGEKAEGGKVLRIRLRGRQPVGGNLFENETVVRLVLIETADDIVAVGPGEGIKVVLVVAARLALGVAVARHVEPVPTPALAVMRRGEQPFHHLCKRVWRMVVDERLHFFRRGRQADEVK